MTTVEERSARSATGGDDGRGSGGAPSEKDKTKPESEEGDDSGGLNFGGARSWISLVLTPVVLASLAGLLAYYVSNTDKSLSETSALSWSDKLWPQIQEHVSITLWSTLWVLLIAVPLGVVLTRPAFRKFTGPVLAVANSGQATPAYGLLVLAYAALGRGSGSVIVALVVFTVLPVLRNTMVGLEQVNQATIEAGRGMGMTKRQTLTRIELPLAVPVILAGVRTALIINVGMAALAYLIGGGGLGVTIAAGLKLQLDLVLFVGAAVTGLLALTVDWIAAVIERILRPKGL